MKNSLNAIIIVVRREIHIYIYVVVSWPIKCASHSGCCRISRSTKHQSKSMFSLSNVIECHSTNIASQHPILFFPRLDINDWSPSQYRFDHLFCWYWAHPGWATDHSEMPHAIDLVPVPINYKSSSQNRSEAQKNREKTKRTATIGSQLASQPAQANRSFCESAKGNSINLYVYSQSAVRHDAPCSSHNAKVMHDLLLYIMIFFFLPQNKPKTNRPFRFA